MRIDHASRNGSPATPQSPAFDSGVPRRRAGGGGASGTTSRGSNTPEGRRGGPGGDVGPRCLNVFYISIALLTLSGVLLFAHSVRLVMQSESKGWRRGNGHAHEVVWVEQQPPVKANGAKAAGGTDTHQTQKQPDANPAGPVAATVGGLAGAGAFADRVAESAKRHKLSAGTHVDPNYVGVVVVVRSAHFPTRLARRLAASRVARMQIVFVAIDEMTPDTFRDGVKGILATGFGASLTGKGDGDKAHSIDIHQGHNGGLATSNRDAQQHAARKRGGGAAGGAGTGGPTVKVPLAVTDDSAFAGLKAEDLNPALAQSKLLRAGRDQPSGIYPTYAELAMMGADAVDPDVGTLLFMSAVHVPTEPFFVDRMLADFLEVRAAAKPPAMPPAMMQCTVAAQADRLDQVRDGLLVAAEQGFEVTLGSMRSQPAVFLSRRHAGVGLRDARLQRRATVAAVSPFCTVADRVRLYEVGGLVAPGPSGVDLAVSGKISGKVVEEALEMLRARVSRVEKTMESISLAEVHAAGNALRQLVREAYAEVVDASALWEELTGKSFDTEISRRLTGPAAAADEKALRAMAHDPINVRLKYHTRLLVEEADHARKVGRSRDAAQIEDEIGWDVSLRLRNAGLSVLATNHTVVYSTEEASPELASLNMLSRPGLAQGSAFPLSGDFNQRWGSYVRALHPAFADATKGPVVRVVWFAICCGCCGFSSEIVHFVEPLQRRYYVNLMPGPKCFCSGYPAATSDAIQRMHLSGEQFILQRSTRDEVLVWISHTDPMNYANDIFARRKPDYIVGRSMYEFSRIGSNWVDASALADEIWVPAKWVRDTFVASGMDPAKLFIIPEGVDTEFYSPTAHTKLDLPLTGQQKESWVHFCNRPAPASSNAYRFFSNFKWEPRKGWETLFEAYELQFGNSERAKRWRAERPPLEAPEGVPATSVLDAERPVSLYVLSYLFLMGPGNIHNVSHMTWELSQMLLRKFPDLDGDVSRLPHFCIITDTVSEVELAQMYARMDAFVLPTRGEGWGLPQIQAMSMAKPVIAPDWGGQGEFMDPTATFIIELDGLDEVPIDTVYGYQFGKKWALPSVNHTAQLMGYVHAHPGHAAAVGRRARELVVRRFSEEAVADVVSARLEAIRAKVVARRAGHTE